VRIKSFSQKTRLCSIKWHLVFLRKWHLEKKQEEQEEQQEEEEEQEEEQA
jgi:hypothetical protein